MEISTEKIVARPVARTRADGLTDPSFIEALVDPVNVFDHPQEVVEHPGFTHEEKRTILLSWAGTSLWRSRSRRV
jgi:hypothetical protein